MTDCLCNVGQRCVACAAKGEPDRFIPGAAWCSVHGALKLSERIRVWQQRVMEQEERERDATP